MNDIKTLRGGKASNPSTQSLKVKTLYLNTVCKQERPHRGKLEKEPVTNNDLKTHEIMRNNVRSQEDTQDPHIVKGRLSITPKKCTTPEASDRAVDEADRNTKRNSDSFLTRFVNVSTDFFTKLVVNTIAVFYNILPTEHQQIRIPRSLPRMQAQLRLYRCQMIASQESCCSTCDPDVLFKIIKSIYDCYKSNKKYTKDNLKCVLRDHLTDQHRLDKASKSIEKGVKWDKTSNDLTPLSGQASEQKESVMKGLVNLDTVLPNGLTISEKELVEKLRNQLGLPQPKTDEKEEKRTEAENLGTPQPVKENKTNEKDNLVKQWNDSGIELSLKKTSIEKIQVESNQLDLQRMREEGTRNTLDTKTPKQLEKIPLRKGKSRKESPNLKNKRGMKVFRSFPADKLAKSGAAFLTSLDDNTLELKESILRGLAVSGMTLPKGRTMSDRKLITKIRNDFGLPLKPNTTEVKKNNTKAQSAGLITSLEGKSNTQKDKLFRNFVEKGMSSPERRTRMAKALLIKKKQVEVSLEPPTAMRLQSKAADFVTSLDSKKKKHTEITRGAIRLPLSQENTCEKKNKEKKKNLQTLSRKSRNIFESKKETKTQTTSSFTPLKTRGQTKQIHRELEKLGISIPENNYVGKPVLLKTNAHLDEKRIEQKEKVFQELALNKLLLAKGWTEREKELIGNIRNESCLSPLPTTGTVKSRHQITPLRMKSAPPKIKLLPVLREMGKPFPESTIPSEKAHINNIQRDVNILPLMPGFQGDNQANAKIARLKTAEQKERILRTLALSGMPLSEGRSASERKLITKVKKNLGLPPGPRTDAEKITYAKAQAAGLITPLEGKSTEQKAKILNKFAGLGISLPQGRTASEKALVKKLKSTHNTKARKKETATETAF